MNITRLLRSALAITIVIVASAKAEAQHSSVSETVHNLSVSGPGEIKSTVETEVCKFCHIPHNPVGPNPLWGHALSQSAGYDVPEIRRGGATGVQPPQPDGASRLCLSCHDGTVALGDVGRSRIPMAGAQHLSPGRRGFLGTDLSGSHPVSFRVEDNQKAGVSPAQDMGLKPFAAMTADDKVRLDPDGKMQCTTCHDPHSDQHYEPGKVPRFWVKTSVDEVCLTCHELR